MTIEQLLEQLRWYPYEANLVVVCANGHEYTVESLDIKDGEVIMKVVDDG